MALFMGLGVDLVTEVVVHVGGDGVTFDDGTPRHAKSESSWRHIATNAVIGTQASSQLLEAAALASTEQAPC